MIKRNTNPKDAPSRTAASVAFYNQFRKRVAGIRTIGQRCAVLDDMQAAFSREVRKNPQMRNALSEAYQRLKMEIWEAVRNGNK